MHLKSLSSSFRCHQEAGNNKQEYHADTSITCIYIDSLISHRCPIIYAHQHHLTTQFIPRANSIIICRYNMAASFLFWGNPHRINVILLAVGKITLLFNKYNKLKNELKIVLPSGRMTACVLRTYYCAQTDVLITVHRPTYLLLCIDRHT
jgi:hypothetical protein